MCSSVTRVCNCTSVSRWVRCGLVCILVMYVLRSRFLVPGWGDICSNYIWNFYILASENSAIFTYFQSYMVNSKQNISKETDFVKSNVKYPSVEKCSFLNLIGILLKISTQGWFLLPTAPYHTSTWLFRQWWLNLILGNVRLVSNWAAFFLDPIWF